MLIRTLRISSTETQLQRMEQTFFVSLNNMAVVLNRSINMLVTLTPEKAVLNYLV